MFSEYPMKAIEELVGKLDQRIFNNREVIKRSGETLNEIYIIY